MHQLLLRHLSSDWTERMADRELWERIEQVPDAELWEVHQVLKGRMVEFVRGRLAERRHREGLPEPVQAPAPAAEPAPEEPAPAAAEATPEPAAPQQEAGGVTVPEPGAQAGGVRSVAPAGDGVRPGRPSPECGQIQAGALPPR